MLAIRQCFPENAFRLVHARCAQRIVGAFANESACIRESPMRSRRRSFKIVSRLNIQF
jgi:hypothetical protein